MSSAKPYRLVSRRDFLTVSVAITVSVSAMTEEASAVLSPLATHASIAVPEGCGRWGPPVELKTAIEKSFTDLAPLKAEILMSATDRFGSGWVWILLGFDGKLKIVSSGNANSPVVLRQCIPLLTIDVW